MMISRIMSKAMMCGRDRAADGAAAGAGGVAGAFGFGATRAVTGLGSKATWCGPVSESVVLTMPPSPGP
jgi:hypothetical protein